MMAKKKIEKVEKPFEKPFVETIYSDKYGCVITKSKAIWDAGQNSWVNMDIEKILNRNRPVGDI